MPAALSERILYWLREMDMLQTELAERVGVSPSAVTRWVQGTANPEYENIERIAAAFNVDLETFFGRHVDAASA